VVDSQKMKQKIIIVLLLSFISLQSYANHLSKLRVILDWFPNPDHAPLIIAQQQGFFKQQGLDVELISPSDPNDAPKWVATHQADVGLTYQPAFMQQVDQGLPLVAIGTLIDKPLNCLAVLKDSNIKSLSDLKGKRIGSTSGSIASVMLMTLLKKQGLTEKNVEIINVKYNLTQALLSHEVAGVTGLMRNIEIPMLESMGHETIAFFPEEHGVPTYNELIFIAHKDLAHDTRFKPFLLALQAAVLYLDQHPKAAWKQFIKTYPEANNQVNKETWFATIPYFAEDPRYFNTDEWNLFAEFMKNNKLIQTPVSSSRYLVN
jgi:putative hydroxymethylpyrimidine transport system substrate-binding protein